MIVDIVVVLTIVIIVIIIIIEITPPMPGMHLTMWLVGVYCQSSPRWSLNSFPAIGLDKVEAWTAKASR